MPAEHKSQLLIAVLGFASVVVTTVSSNWDKWFPRLPKHSSRHVNLSCHRQSVRDRHDYAARDHHTARQRSTTGRPNSARDATAALHSQPTRHRCAPRHHHAPARVTTTPPATPKTPAMIPPSAFPHRLQLPPRVLPRLAMAPRWVRGSPSKVFWRDCARSSTCSCVKSQAFGRLIYPQGKALPDATGQWTVDSIYGTPGYSYETFLVVTTNAEAAAMLSDQHARKYGLRELPPGTERLGNAIVVTRE